MSGRTVAVLFLAVICGIASAYGVVEYRGSLPPPSANVETTPVVVAAVDIPLIGTELLPDMVQLADWPQELVPADAITSIEDAVGKTIQVQMLKGEPLRESKVGEGRGLASLVAPGMRAYTILTPSDSSGVAGLILPGDRVDVILSRLTEDDAPAGGGIATTLLQNVEVLAADQFINAPADNRVERMRSVTLLVTPAMAARLTLAQNKGTLSLSLRNRTDVAEARTKPVLWREMESLEEYLPVEKYLSIAAAAVSSYMARQPAEKETPPAADTNVTNVAPQAAPLQIQTLRGRSVGLVFVQR